jgi:hypothetical protein
MSRPLPVDTGRGVGTECAWCDQPATESLKDQRRTRLASGTTFLSGPGTRYPACRDCAARIEGRYLKRKT